MATAMPPSAAAPLRVIVAGLGRIGFAYHAATLARHPAFDLVGLVDPLPERRAEAEAAWGTPAFATLAAALTATDPDVVVLASPTPFHHDQARASFAAGCHVVCDKPVALTLDEFDAMAVAAHAADRRLLAYQPARWHASVLALKSILQSGRLGRLHTIVRNRSDFQRRNDWQALRAHGGGMLNNYGSHCLDELLWLLGTPDFRTVFCTTDRLTSAGDAEDQVKALLRTADDVLIDLTISQATALTPPQWQVQGTCGAAVWDQAGAAWVVRCFDPVRFPPPPLQTGLAAADRRYQTEAIAWQEFRVPAADFPPPDFYQRVADTLRLDAPPPVTLAESRALLALVTRCRESADTGQPS